MLIALDKWLYAEKSVIIILVMFRLDYRQRARWRFASSDAVYGRYLVGGLQCLRKI
jgi:hypothetical protein